MAGKISLITQDGENIEVDVEVIKQSKIITQMMNDLGEEADVDSLPIPNVNSAILKKVIEWCSKHKDDKPEDDDDEESTKSDTNLPEWDTEFFKVDQGTLFGITNAADFLDIPKLLDYACITIADQIRGKSAEEIRKHLNIKKRSRQGVNDMH